MAAISVLAAKDPIKMLNVGDTGTGKSGALLALAEAGFKLRFADFDNGVVGVYKALRGPEALAKLDIDVRRYMDKLKRVPATINGKQQMVLQVVRQPTAWERFLGDLDVWPDHGPVSGWGPDTILILDSLTFASSAALNWTLVQNNRSGQQPFQSDWGDAMRGIEHLLALLYSDTIKCHVIVNSHLVPIGTKVTDETTGKTTEEDVNWYPSALGNKLPPKVGRFFNVMVRSVAKKSGGAVRRVILTQPDGQVGIKVPATGIARELPIPEGGMLTLFGALGWSRPPQGAAAEGP